MSLTNTAENGETDWFLRGQAAPTLPASWHLALFTSDPGETGAGTEVSGSGYARLAVLRSLANFSGTQGPGTTTASTGTGGRSSNNNTLTWPTATGTWGTITHVGFMDAATGGVMHAYAPLATPRTINNGDVFEIVANALGVTRS